MLFDFWPSQTMLGPVEPELSKRWIIFYVYSDSVCPLQTEQCEQSRSEYFSRVGETQEPFSSPTKTKKTVLQKMWVWSSVELSKPSSQRGHWSICSYPLPPSIFAEPNKLPFSQGTTVPVQLWSRSRRPAREPVSKNNHKNTEMESHEVSKRVHPALHRRPPRGRITSWIFQVPQMEPRLKLFVLESRELKKVPQTASTQMGPH